MAEKLLVDGGNRLRGSVPISGAKNSALKLMAASLLASGRTVIHNVPRIVDCLTMGEVLDHLGAGVQWDGNTVSIDTSKPDSPNLTWTDSTQPAGIVTPGTYTILFAKNGFQSISKTFSCSAGTCGPGTVTLLEFPQGTGVVSVDSLLPGTTSVDWSRATVNLTTQAPGSAALSIGLASSTGGTKKPRRGTRGSLFRRRGVPDEKRRKRRAQTHRLNARRLAGVPGGTYLNLEY